MKNEELISKLMVESMVLAPFSDVGRFDAIKFAELIVEECRNVVTEVYRNTPLELCGPLLTVDEEILNHFYGVTEDD
jgi:hypothetical protein